MWRKSVFLGLFTVLSASVSIGYALTARANVEDSQGCYMQAQTGMVTDLSKICGQVSTSASSLKIDPNTPIQIKLVGQEKPSELWNTIPNLPSEPTKGKTYEQAPPQKLQLIGGAESK